MSYQKEREQFISQFPGTYADACTFLRNASAEQVWNEKQCSFEMSDKETAKQEKRSENRMKRVRALAEKLGYRLDENGDPRGNPFALIRIDSGRTLSVPARGLPARCFR